MVWQAYGSHPSIGTYAGQYPDALSAWNHAELKHVGDKNPPAGVPVYFGVSPTRTDANKAAGDVVISLGNGLVIGTDVGGAGHIGITSITDRAAAISRPYLGWAADFCGYDVIYNAMPPASTAGLVSAILNNGDNNMDELWEYFKINGDTSGTIYVSWNRLGYWGMSGTTFTDHQYWLKNVRKAPVPVVQSVSNAQAFGPKLG